MFSAQSGLLAELVSAPLLARSLPVRVDLYLLVVDVTCVKSLWSSYMGKYPQNLVPGGRPYILHPSPYTIHPNL